MPDHATCNSLLTNQNPSTKLARWSMTIQELDVDICHHAGTSNLLADALSRHQLLTAEVLQNEVGPPSQCNTSNVGTLQRQDEELAPMFRYLEEKIVPSGERHAKRLSPEKEDPNVPGVWRIAVLRAL